MKEYIIEWSILDNSNMSETLGEMDRELLECLDTLCQPQQLLSCDSLEPFDGSDHANKIFRPKGSHRAFYVNYGSSNAVIAIKGTEAVSSELKAAMAADRLNLLPHRPWSKFENFIYREQKAPLAMLFNEARDEVEVGMTYQASTFKNFGFFEEAPLPLLLYKWSSEATQSYVDTIAPYLDGRARDLLFPLIDTYGLGGIVYHYQYLPTRVRFSSSEASECDGNELLSAVDNLIGIVARMLLSGFMPFDFEDHGVGQCVAPQNVTLRGGICDLGSIKNRSGMVARRTYALLQALGTVLTRTVTEILDNSVSDTVYEFDNPTPLQHYLSAVVHNKLLRSLHLESRKYGIKIPEDLNSYFNTNNSNLVSVLGFR